MESNVLTEKSTIFTITYDNGSKLFPETLQVSHVRFYENESFQHCIIYQRCHYCGFESRFKRDKK